MNQETIQQLVNDRFTANGLIGEVSSATGIDSGLLLEDDAFRACLTGYVVSGKISFKDAVKKLTDYANSNF